jgi:hypothetical protein
MREPTECPVRCGNRAAAGAFRVWDGPLSVGECPRTVNSTRRSFSNASQKVSSGSALERRGPLHPLRPETKVMPEPARTGRGPSPARCRRFMIRNMRGMTHSALLGPTSQAGSWQISHGMPQPVRILQPGTQHRSGKSRRSWRHARRTRLPQILVGFTRMKFSASPSVHGASVASMTGARSASVSR